MAALTLYCQSQAVTTDTIWLPKPKVFTLWLFTEEILLTPEIIVLPTVTLFIVLLFKLSSIQLHK